MRTPVRIPPSSPPPCDDPIAIYRALFRNSPPLTVNVGEFTCCDLEGCDCGATIRLGVDAATLIALLGALSLAGLTVRAVPPPDLSLLPTDWRSQHPFSSWAGPIQVGEEAATKSKAAMKAMIDYLRQHGVAIKEVTR